MTGIAAIINPKNNELILYISLSNKLAKIVTAKPIPIIHPRNSFAKNFIDLIFSSFVPFNK